MAKAKSSGGITLFGIDLASQSWMTYMTLVFAVFYGYRLFKIISQKLSPTGTNPKAGKTFSTPEAIPEEDTEEKVVEEIPEHNEDQPDQEPLEEEKKTQ